LAKVAAKVNRLLNALESQRLSKVNVIWSDDCKQAAQIYGQMADKAYRFEEAAFEVSPKLELCVLNEKDWRKMPFGKFQPYGDPVCPENRVFVGTEAPASWKNSTTSTVKNGSQDARKKLIMLSGENACNDVKLAVDALFSLRFFAPSVAHEIAHLFQAEALMIPHNIDFDGIEKRGNPGKLDFFWIGEFICQYAQLAFLEEYDALLCDKWLKFYRILYEAGKDLVRYKEMSQWGPNYSEMIKDYIRIIKNGDCDWINNILWYQSKAMLMASDLYEKHGIDFLRVSRESLGISHRWVLRSLTCELEDFAQLLDKWEEN
jgi:hypothetical protein